jgi:hypothetical protein
MLFGMVLGRALLVKGFDFEEAFYYVSFILLIIILINSIVVITGFYNPGFREITESILDLRGSNIDYRVRVNRLRGLAGGGAANLSVIHGVALVLLLGFFLNRRISLVLFSIFFVTIGFSIFFIGRTGLVVAAIGCTMLIFLNFLKPNRSSIIRFFLFFLVFIIFFVYGIGFFRETVSSGIYKYSIGFLSNGIEGFYAEGTADTLLDSITTPKSLWEALFGVGTHNGSFLVGSSSDIGYMKSITALGLPLAFVFYFVLLTRFRKAIVLCSLGNIVLVLLALMLVVDLKEPLMIKGYFSRYMWLIAGMSIIYFRERSVV